MTGLYGPVEEARVQGQLSHSQGWYDQFMYNCSIVLINPELTLPPLGEQNWPCVGMISKMLYQIHANDNYRLFYFPGILGSTILNYIRLKQIKNSIKETGITLGQKTDDLTDLVKAQDNQMGSQASELKESFFTQSKLLEQKLEELASVLNFVTLNLASDPLKEFGIHIQPPVDAKSFASGQSSVSQNQGANQNQGNIADVINSLTSRIDSIIEVMKINQHKTQGDFLALKQYLENLDNSVLQHEERTVEELEKLAKCIRDKSDLSSSVEVASMPKKFAESDQWWSKASTLTSILCTILTATVLLHEFLKWIIEKVI